MKNHIVLLLFITLMSVYKPVISCEVGELNPFSSVHKVVVDSAWTKLTDTATIDLPKNLRISGNRKNQTLNNINAVIRKGDAVKITAGYDPNTYVRFQGFVTSVSKSTPISITCEDYMYLFKLDSYTFSLKNPTLSDIVKRVMSGVNINDKISDNYSFDLSVSDTEPLYDQFTARSETGAQILQRVIDEMPFAAYFIIDPDGQNKPVLVVGYRPGFGTYTVGETNLKPVLRFGSNVPESGWQVEYQNEEDVKVKIKAISNLKNGKKLIVEVGDNDGETHTRNYPPISKDQLTQYANEELKNFKRDGFKGKVTAFAEPFIKHSDVVILDDSIYTQDTDRLLVDQTILTITDKPTIRCEVIPGLKV